MTNTIQVQSTPNPNARKFIVPGIQFSGSTNYSTPQAAAGAVWVDELFALAGVYNVFTAQNFVTVNKRPEVDWEPLDAEIRQILNRHLCADTT